MPNPVTGDRVEFLNSPLHGARGPLVFRTHLAPSSIGAPLHSHRRTQEFLRVESGVLTVDVGGVSRSLAAGDAVSLRAGAPHALRNESDETTTFVATLSAGQDFEKLLRTFYGLAGEGRTDRAGLPRDPRELAMALEYGDASLGAAGGNLQRVLNVALAALGRAIGLEFALARFWPDALDEAAPHDAINDRPASRTARAQLRNAQT